VDKNVVNTKRLIVFLMLGGLYGVTLSSVGFMLAGAGHGTYMLLAIASAPLSLLGGFWFFVGPPLLWTMVGSVLAYSSRILQRQIVFFVLSLHYVSGPIAWFVADYADLKYFEGAWQINALMLLGGITFYMLGQISIWAYWLKQGRLKSPANDD
jgi:hypothetical protein